MSILEGGYRKAIVEIVLAFGLDMPRHSCRCTRPVQYPRVNTHKANLTGWVMKT